MAVQKELLGIIIKFMWSIQSVYTFQHVSHYLDCHSNIPQFIVFQQYYSKLFDCLPVKDLSHYLVSQGVITLMDSEDITSLTTSKNQAAEMLMHRVSLSLQDGNAAPFTKLLDVMQKHGNDAIVTLSSEILRLLHKTNGKIKKSLHM